MLDNVVSPESLDVVFKMVDLAIQKGLAVYVVVCLHFT
jgi:hypothetical protein